MVFGATCLLIGLYYSSDMGAQGHDIIAVLLTISGAWAILVGGLGIWIRRNIGQWWHKKKAPSREPKGPGVG